jgi:hypothetical protein
VGLAAGVGVIGIGLLLFVIYLLFGNGIIALDEPTETSIPATMTVTIEPTSVASPTPVSTMTPDYAATQAAVEDTAVAMEAMNAIQIAREWPVLVWDDFDDNQNEWMVGEIEDDYSTMNLEVSDRYIWEVYAKRGFVWRVWPRSEPVSDFYLTVEVQNLSENLEARYGLIFWNDQNSYYYIEVRDSGFFLVSHYDGQGWNNIIDYTESTAISPREVNRLETAMIDETFYLLINGILLAEVPGFSPSEGQAGVAVGLSEQGEESLIAFDRYILKAPFDE